jgi:hypothetical protein
LLAVCLTAGAEIESSSADVAPFRVVAYVAGWSMPQSFPAERLSHINLAFARMNSRLAGVPRTLIVSRES